MLSLSSQTGRVRKAGMKQRGNQTLQKKIMDSEDSDEDYVAEADEVDEQSDDLDSLVGGALVEESCFEEEEENGWRTVVKSKQRAKKAVSKSRKNGLNRSKKRRKVTHADDDDSDDDEFKPDEFESLEEEEEEEEVEEVEEEEEEEEEEEYEEEEEEEEAEEKEEEEEDDDDDEKHEREGVWRTVAKPKLRTRKGSRKSRKIVVNRSKKRRKVVCDDDDDDSDDLDDVEFAPNEFEHLDDDDEDDDDDDDEEEEEEDEKRFPKAKSKTKKRRTTSKRKTSVRRAGTARKASKQGRKKKGSAVRNQKKRKRGHGKKRATVDSDLDICSDSSDREFTISEEEREQVREADLYCRALATNLRSSRKIQEDEAFCKPNKPPARKGKEKAEETRNDIGKPVCGICLTEEGKSSVRGTLNCCTHFFCFACIMEWSKVETRCPLCKQRFVTISKATRCGKGFDQKKTVVTVPERDQVYQPSEEELRDFLNPYENVICTECDQGGDDALMLLCDVCDSPAHTYCVGLGREVPEGNWYCDGCRPAVLASSQPQLQGLMAEQRAGASASDRQTTYENMSEIDLNVTIPETPLSQGDGLLASPRFSGGGLQLPSPGSGIGVSTVSGRRRIHRQIHYILSNRMSQTGGELSSLGNIIGLGVNTTFHHGRTHVGTSHSVQQFGRYNGSYSHSMPNMDSGLERLGNMTRHVSQPLPDADGLSHGHRAWSGLDSIHLEATQSQLSTRGTLQPCTSRSNMGPDTGGLSSENREDEHANCVKREVHSIVENQLQSMTRSMSFGDNIYLEIIKRSEHTIMAAYGLEPQRRDTFVVHPPICTHLLGMLANVETSPMNGCCLVCFQGFVKLVVKSFVDIMMAPHYDFRY